jgi:hypothetical protein
MNLPIGWLQLRHRPLRLLVALLGISFAVLLIMMQLATTSPCSAPTAFSSSVLSRFQFAAYTRP